MPPGLAAGRFGKRTGVTLASTALEPALPTARGPLSLAVVNLLTERVPRSRLDRIEASVADCDPFGIDVQLTLCVCYELHYRGFAGVDPDWEWNPGLLHLRARLEDAFLAAVHRAVGDRGGPETIDGEMDRLLGDPVAGSSPSEHLRTPGTWQQVREYFVHRSLYHLKEGDPHAWALPRLNGQAKASFAAVEFDEFGAGRGDKVRQQLFAELMVAADLDPGYLAYLDLVPAEALTVVNLMSLFGLHRRHRGAAMGHFAATAITASPGSRRMLAALDRLNAPDPCRDFYRGHAAAAAMHEEAIRTDVVGDLVGREPDLAVDVVFGMRAFAVMEDRLATHLMRSWGAGDSSLRHPLN